MHACPHRAALLSYDKAGFVIIVLLLEGIGKLHYEERGYEIDDYILQQKGRKQRLYMIEAPREVFCREQRLAIYMRRYPSLSDPNLDGEEERRRTSRHLSIYIPPLCMYMGSICIIGMYVSTPPPMIRFPLLGISGVSYIYLLLL
jgi:hypothetical protein